MLLCLVTASCGGGSLQALRQVPLKAFQSQTSSRSLTVRGRLCSYDEIRKSFSCYEDFFHYYYLLHLRCENKSFARYAFIADHQAFFIPPVFTLKKYTQSSVGMIGGAISWVTTFLLLPFYVINAAKSTFENPYPVDIGKEHSILIPRNFALITGAYFGIAFGPFLGGMLLQKHRSNANFRKAQRSIVSQGEQVSIAPYKHTDILVMIPRASFTEKVSISLYNYHTKKRERYMLKLCHQK